MEMTGYYGMRPSQVDGRLLWHETLAGRWQDNYGMIPSQIDGRLLWHETLAGRWPAIMS